eukprot:1373176-Pyramimonas_sp.AAC.1
MGDNAWSCIQNSDYDFYAIVGTPVHQQAALRRWEGKARGRGLRTVFNPARPRDRQVSLSQEEHANEGGEWLLAKNHLRVHRLPAVRAAGSRLMAPSHKALDGFAVIMGLGGANVGRFQRLSGLLHALQLPWLVIGDFNMSPAALTKTGLPQKIGGMIVTADVEATHLLSTGTHIDYIMSNIAARPFILQ